MNAENEKSSCFHSATPFVLVSRLESRSGLLELVEQSFIADPQFICGALAIAAGRDQNFRDQLTLDLGRCGPRCFLQRQRLALPVRLHRLEPQL